jgi:sodium/proline symporter
MGAALVLVPVIAIVHLGGWNEMLHSMQLVNPALLDPFTDNRGQNLGWIASISLMAWGLGYFGQPHILARFMAIRHVRNVPHARRIAMSWVSLSLAGALLAGVAGIGAVQPALSGADTEKVFMQLVAALLHPVPAGICLAAILAAIMSTADSQLLVSSSALTEDFYKNLLRPAAGQEELVWVGRATVVLIALAAYALALDPDSQVLELVAYAWAGFGAAFGPTIILSLFWPPMNRFGAMAGIIIGGVTVMLWKQLYAIPTGLYEIVPGFMLSTLAIVLVSLATREKRV